MNKMKIKSLEKNSKIEKYTAQLAQTASKPNWYAHFKGKKEKKKTFCKKRYSIYRNAIKLHYFSIFAFFENNNNKNIERNTTQQQRERRLSLI